MLPAMGADGANRRVRVTTREMAYGPHAVAHDAGRVLFVRGAAPHEELEVVVREQHRTFGFADTVRVLRPSAERRDPPCAYLPRCGGCPWQHLGYEAQLRAKESLVREQLRRLARLDVALEPMLRSPREYGYRHRLKLRVENGAIGFYAAASHSLVPIEHCLLADPRIADRMPAVAELAAALRTRLRRIEPVVSEDDQQLIVVGEAEGAWASSDDQLCRGWLERTDGVRGLVLAGRGWRRCWGDDRVEIRPEEDLPLWVRGGSFTQVNSEANRVLVRAVLEAVEPRPEMSILDLYAGAGNLSLPLARRGSTVVAVEQNARSAADGRRNARRLGLRGCTFLTNTAEAAARDLVASGRRFEVAVLDPPRSGAFAVLPPLIELAPARLVYVSCDPATLARDLERLLASYRVERVQPIDLFPHTYHVENVVVATHIGAR